MINTEASERYGKKIPKNKPKPKKVKLNNAKITNFLPGQWIFKILRVLIVVEKRLKFTVKFGRTCPRS